MAIDFNHTIVSARDSKASAEFLAEMLGLPAPRKWGPFQMVVVSRSWWKLGGAGTEVAWWGGSGGEVKVGG
jgi:hypothetical protein